MNEYVYVYKNSMNIWDSAKNPVFIAKHGYCRAIPAIEVKKAGFKSTSNLVYNLNEMRHKELDEYPICLLQIVKDWDLV